MISMLFGIGVFGILGLSILCPILAWPGYYLQHKSSRTRPSPAPAEPFCPSRIDIIIPAYNEEGKIGRTLATIQRSVWHYQEHNSAHPLELFVHVAADGCTDKTVSIARDFPIVHVTEFMEKKGKWATIKSLLADTSADWVILVDVGTLWPENFITDFVRAMTGEPKAMAIAPSYRPLTASWVPRLL